MKERKYEYRKLDEIKPYEKNPRRNDQAVDAVAKSIQEFGFNVPIVIDRNGVIVAGHTRYKAAVKLGLGGVPCVSVNDLTEKQVKAYRLADNKVAELSAWDFGILNEELEDIGGDIDMEGFGFNPEEKDVDMSSFFEDSEPKEKEPKQIKCPHCGQWFTP